MEGREGTSIPDRPAPPGFVLELAGARLAFRSAGFPLRDVHDYYIPFLRPLRASADVEFLVRAGRFPRRPASARALYRAPGNWRVYRERDGYRFETMDLELRRTAQVARLDPGLTRGEVFVRPRRGKAGGSGPSAPTWSLHQLVGPVATHCLIRFLAHSPQPGLLCHASGVIDAGRGILFVGRSGTGKTTLWEFWRRAGATVLGDERTLIRRLGGEYRVFGSPWPGSRPVATDASAPLRQIYLISHGTRHSVRPQGLTQSFAAVYPQVYGPRWDARTRSAQLQVTEDLLRSVPCSALSFRKDPDVVAFLRERHGAAMRGAAR
ncbi:MAG: hypothetical protein HY608_08610 [Planctomycetes bacterium]|nr:hypothetical protein [Planctomycetota bacterium]